MRLPLLLSAALCSAAFAQPPKAPTPTANVATTRCADLNYLARQDRPKAKVHKLTELPPADASYAMLRTRNGCPDLTPVRMRR